MGGLLFDVEDLHQEILAFTEMARDHLAPGGPAVLQQAAFDLIEISKGFQSKRWEIRANAPLLTRVSRGDYMRGGKGKLNIYAAVSFVWEIHPVRAKGTSKPAKQVRLDGLASTAISIRQVSVSDSDPDVELAYWRMEVADSQAPGTFFHVQVMGRDDDEVFPKDMDVPRLPSVLCSPFACMEFVLGELFQDDWPAVTSKDVGPVNMWSGIQRRRLSAHLKWVADQTSGYSGSPYARWKKIQPPERLFLKRP